MSKKRFKISSLKQFLPYIICGITTLTLAIFGSLGKNNVGASINLSAIAGNNYQASTDQISELFTVASVSDAIGLSNSSDLASNYVILLAMQSFGQTSTTKLEKPITNIVASRGVLKHTVTDGESIDNIAAKYGISTDQIRWSNNMKNKDLSAGTILNIPSRSGIVYTVKSSDTLGTIVEKYGSNATEIITLNDLETSGISEGMQILIAGGSLPEKERPEYVPPAPRVSYNTLGNTAERINITVRGYFYNLGGPYVPGQCTQWAWYKSGGRIPGNFGNAKDWAARAAGAGFTVSSTPVAGAIFQTRSGTFGHVGYVESVNPDGSINVSEMNYSWQPYRVIDATIPAHAVSRFNYIY